MNIQNYLTQVETELRIKKKLALLSLLLFVESYYLTRFYTNLLKKQKLLFKINFKLNNLYLEFLELFLKILQLFPRLIWLLI